MSGRFLVLLVPLAVAVLAVAAACGGDDEGGGAPPSAVGVKALDFLFQPAELTAEAGDTLTVEVENQGNVPHTFTIDELSVDEVLSPGQSVTVSLTPTQAATLSFYCRFHRDRGMEGVLRVSAGPVGPSQGEATPPSGGDGQSGGGGYYGY